jgi:hypothetical protein
MIFQKFYQTIFCFNFRKCFHRTEMVKENFNSSKCFILVIAWQLLLSPYDSMGSSCQILIMALELLPNLDDGMGSSCPILMMALELLPNPLMMA